MYREPRSLNLAQRIVTWAWGLCEPAGRRAADPLVEQQRRLALAARRLEISEFEFFARAYRAWYGAAPDLRALEWEFGRYLNQQCALPFYVRRFVGRIGALAA